MAIKNCHHHGFTVADMEQSIRFYRDLLGLKLLQDAVRQNIPAYNEILGYDDVKLRVVILQDDNETVMVELQQYLNPPGQDRQLENRLVGSSHLAFEVDDIDATYQKLADAGVNFISDNVVDVIRDGKFVARAVYALDPSGISVELLQQVSGEIDKALGRQKA